MKKHRTSVGLWLSVIVLTILFVFYSCKKDESTSTTLSIKSFNFTHNMMSYTAYVDNTSRTISPPEEFRFTEIDNTIVPIIVLEDEENSTINPESGKGIEVSSPFTYIITDKHNSNLRETYTLDFSSKKYAPVIQSFEFTYDGKKYATFSNDEEETISLPTGLEFFRDNDTISPQIELRDKNSTISPGTGEKINMKEKTIYTVTDSEGSTEYKLDFRDAERFYGLANKNVVLYEDFSEMPTVPYDPNSPNESLGKPTGVVKKDDDSKFFIFHSAGQLYVPFSIGKKTNEVGAYYTRGEGNRGSSKLNIHQIFQDNDWDKADGVTYKITIECETGTVPDHPPYASKMPVFLCISFSEHYLGEVKASSGVVDPIEGHKVSATDVTIRKKVEHKDGPQTVEIEGIQSKFLDNVGDEAEQNLLIYVINGDEKRGWHWGHKNNFSIYSIKIEKKIEEE